MAKQESIAKCAEYPKPVVYKAEIAGWGSSKPQVDVQYVTWKRAGVPKYTDPPKWDTPYDSCPEYLKGKRKIRLS